MKRNLQFLLKVVRNGLILAGLYFFSIWASNETLTFQVCKPILIFLGTYIFAELAKKYGLKEETLRSKKAETLVF